MDDLIESFGNIDISKKEYIDKIKTIIKELYDSKCGKNETTTGIKNKNQKFEDVTEEILEKFCTKINNKSEINDDNLYFIAQPNGSQAPPDFMIVTKKYNDVKIECKSSKSLKPTWNCSIPEKDTIYAFYTSKLDLTFIFSGDEIISDKKIEEIIKFHNKIKEMAKEFNNSILKDQNLKYYPRQMINQVMNFDVGKRETYYENIIEKIKLLT